MLEGEMTSFKGRRQHFMPLPVYLYPRFKDKMKNPYAYNHSYQ